MSNGRDGAGSRTGPHVPRARLRSHGRITSGSAERSPSRGMPTPAGGVEPNGQVMRAARRRWASGIAVLTTLDSAGDIVHYRGATVSSLTMVSLDPPLVLVCIDPSGAMANLIGESGVFAVSVLDRAHEFQADQFAGLGPLPDPQFRGVPFELAENGTGCPVLGSALAWFDCTVESTHDGGDHLIVLGRVVAVGVGLNTDDPLLNYEGAYRRIEGA